MEQYYIPKIEDLRIGYEYEILIKANDPNSIILGGVDEDTWIKEVVIPNIRLKSFINPPFEWRVSYLTKEQIEKEGWNYSWEDAFNFFFIKEDYELAFSKVPVPTINILKGDTQKKIFKSSCYFGECPSINELRTIMKLLKIK